uniref:Uncharacterized protein n=1 Tax=Chromera velia CCMP2878 TaxID=1169474 RepID=A0A0G4I8U2_9ALVE|eukprot:Cvel_11969.t1-p1 / transcript=Cvel_11969.t1 / gene=Cvel_11969 / organism=Chromera_velia_CCMP2878 / gene_product=hypothetical protein / transcript_product=hypothetical protein / location=Cvel_scaffold767:21569-21937(-) / protein_length=123 / sequence_SO=supercontig / SO=protein_coding / is_pseudo=false
MAEPTQPRTESVVDLLAQRLRNGIASRPDYVEAALAPRDFGMMETAEFVEQFGTPKKTVPPYVPPNSQKFFLLFCARCLLKNPDAQPFLLDHKIGTFVSHVAKCGEASSRIPYTTSRGGRGGV